MERYPTHLVIRPSDVIGPQDYTQRFSTWVNRLAAGGVVEVPGSPEVPIQYIDVRDLAAFAVSALEARLQGVFHVATPSHAYSFGQLLREVMQGVAPAGTQLRWPWMPVPLLPMVWSLARWHTLHVMSCEHFQNMIHRAGSDR